VAQISLYVNDELAKKLTSAASSKGCSVSKYVADIIHRHFTGDAADEFRKKQLLQELCGSIKDPTFVEPPEIPWSAETNRRYDLL